MTDKKKKSLPELVVDYLDEIDHLRIKDPDSYIKYLKLLRKSLDDALSQFTQKQIAEAREQLNKNVNTN